MEYEIVNIGTYRGSHWIIRAEDAAFLLSPATSTVPSNLSDWVIFQQSRFTSIPCTGHCFTGVCHISKSPTIQPSVLPTLSYTPCDTDRLNIQFSLELVLFSNQLLSCEDLFTNWHNATDEQKCRCLSVVSPDILDSLHCVVQSNTLQINYKAALTVNETGYHCREQCESNCPCNRTELKTLLPECDIIGIWETASITRKCECLAGKETRLHGVSNCVLGSETIYEFMKKSCNITVCDNDVFQAQLQVLEKWMFFSQGVACKSFSNENSCKCLVKFTDSTFGDFDCLYNGMNQTILTTDIACTDRCEMPNPPDDCWCNIEELQYKANEFGFMFSNQEIGTSCEKVFRDVTNEVWNWNEICVCWGLLPETAIEIWNCRIKGKLKWINTKTFKQIGNICESPPTVLFLKHSAPQTKTTIFYLKKARLCRNVY